MSVGMRESVSGTRLRVSSSVDQTTCCKLRGLCGLRHVARLAHLFGGREMFPVVGHAVRAVRAFKRLRERRFVVEIRLDDLGAELAQGFAFSPFALRVMARARKPLDASARMARTRPPPCAPVAPTTAMILEFCMRFSTSVRAQCTPSSLSLYFNQ